MLDYLLRYLTARFVWQAIRPKRRRKPYRADW